MFARMIRPNPALPDHQNLSGLPAFVWLRGDGIKRQLKDSGKPCQKQGAKFRIFCLFFMALSQNKNLSKRIEKNA
ncbi:MAG: hypothetical protein ACOYLL_11890 [Beijerinckiaceae bacterium]